MLLKKGEAECLYFWQLAACLIQVFFRVFILVHHTVRLFLTITAPALCQIPTHVRKTSSYQDLRLYHSQATNQGGSLAVIIPGQGSMSMLVTCQSSFTCTEDCIQQPLSCMIYIWCQRAEKLSEFWHMECKQVRAGGNPHKSVSCSFWQLNFFAVPYSHSVGGQIVSFSRNESAHEKFNVCTGHWYCCLLLQLLFIPG